MIELRKENFWIETKTEAYGKNPITTITITKKILGAEYEDGVKFQDELLKIIEDNPILKALAERLRLEGIQMIKEIEKLKNDIGMARSIIDHNERQIFALEQEIKFLKEDE